MTDKRTRYGTIHYGGPCDDSYPNIEHETHGGQFVKLQRPALRSFNYAVKDMGEWIHITGSWRSCELQAELYAKDPNRYAPPAESLHCRGLAIDVATNVSKAKFDKIHRILTHRGWYRARPDDEPWHHSFGISG